MGRLLVGGLFLVGSLLLQGRTALGSASSELSLPLEEKAWVSLAFNKIPVHQLSFAKGVMSIQVKQSAGPIVHKLTKPTKVTGFAVKGLLRGQKAVESGGFDEDSILRFGLVAIGQKTLSGPKQWFAADWVKRLFALAPPGVGLDKIYFFNLTNRAEIVGKMRTHPKSDLIHEEIVAKVQGDGRIEFQKQLASPLEIAAIWMSIDGDDTQSSFEVDLTELRLNETSSAR